MLVRHLAVALVLSIATILHAEGSSPVLRFAEGDGERLLDLATLIERCGETRVEVDDPYYERPMAFRAVSLRCVLAEGFEGATAEDDFSLIALESCSLCSKPRKAFQPLASSGSIAATSAS